MTRSRWRSKKAAGSRSLRGSWFIEAFEGPMSNLQRFVAGEDAALVSPVDDAIKTMALVEACYLSSASGGTPDSPRSKMKLETEACE